MFAVDASLCRQTPVVPLVIGVIFFLPSHVNFTDWLVLQGAADLGSAPCVPPPWVHLLGSPPGIKYDKHAVAFCPATSKVAMIPESLFPDTMHNILASGGVLQFEQNQLTRRITRQSCFSRANDSFAQTTHSCRRLGLARFCRKRKETEASDSEAAEKLLCWQPSQRLCG